MIRRGLFTLAVLLIASSSYATTAEEMLSRCRQIAQSPVRDQPIEIPQTTDAAMCWGAFVSLQEVVQWVDTVHSKTPLVPMLQACVPEGSTRSQLIAIFVDYVERNPKYRSDAFAFVAVKALRATFPCGKTAPKK